MGEDMAPVMSNTAKRGIFILMATFCSIASQADEPFAISRCEVVPLADNQVSFRILGIEKTRWHFDEKYPRPFFFPLQGPSGSSLTRMGHPGAPNHDHHQSIWFAHHDVEGKSFWANGKGTQVRQNQWNSYVDGEDEAVMASELGWIDDTGGELLHQELCAAVSPLRDGEYTLEVQLTFTPGQGRPSTQVGKTNFGFFAVRVAKSISAVFGGGQLTDSEKRVGEKDIFGKQARWMDYSGPIASGVGDARRTVTEGITFHDHPSNRTYPTRWHVRSDGWMGASPTMDGGLTITAENPLRMRYLLHVHSGSYSHDVSKAMHKAFTERPAFEIVDRPRTHRHQEVRRVPKPSIR